MNCLIKPTTLKFLLNFLFMREHFCLHPLGEEGFTSPLYIYLVHKYIWLNPAFLCCGWLKFDKHGIHRKT